MSEENRDQSAYRPKPSLKDRLGFTKESLVHIAMAVIIAVIISAVVFTQTGVSQGAYNEEQAQMAQSIATQGSQITGNDQNIAEIRDDVGAIMEQYSGVANTVALHTGSIEGHGNRLTTLEGNVTKLQDDFAAVCSPPEAYLTGNLSGNLTIHAEASETGNYTANVHLVFVPGLSVGNATTNSEAIAAFYAGGNYSAKYIPIASYNSTDWAVGQVWWNIGTFELAADTEKVINVLLGSLADTVSFAYVEIYPALE